MRVSHEAIYQSLYVQGRGALRRELTACLRTGRALRVPRARVGARGKGFVTDEVMISQRPAEADDRAVPGHWEGDLILGTRPLGDRHAGRAHQPLHDAAAPAADARPRRPEGQERAGAHRRTAPRRSATRSPPRSATLPEQLRRSLTWDQGAEMAQHARLRIDTGLQVYFCDPQSPWQRGTNENTNGLLRQYFPKGTDLARHSADDLAAVAAALNSRPRKTLGWRTPAEVLDEHLARGRLTASPTHDAQRHLGRPGRRPRAWLSPLRPALRASLRDDSPRGLHPTRSEPRRYGPLTDNPVLRRPLESGAIRRLGFGQKARDAGIAVSMGSKGDAYDNAVAESFFATLKKELVHRRSWPTRRELISEVFEFVEGFYNTTRRHSTLGYLSPAQFETMTTINNNKDNG